MVTAPPRRLSRRRFMAAAGASAVAAPMFANRAASAQGGSGLNLLHIILDDANDWFDFLGPADPLIGRLVAHAPNLAALAEESLVFDRAYCVVPQCAGSRIATIIGVSPERTGLEYDQAQHAPGRPRCDAETGEGCYPWWFASGLGLTGDLAAANYRQFSAGKVAHIGRKENFAPLPQPLDLSRWGNRRGWQGVRARYLRQVRERSAPGFSGHAAANWVNRGPAIDGIIAKSLLDQWPLPSDQPWHVIAGFVGTHTPFVVRQRWVARYSDIPDPAPEAIARADQSDIPRLGSYGERFADIDREERLGIVRAYLSSLSEVDLHIGRLLDQLVLTKELDSTVVVVWTDHGYALGHKLHYGKNRLQEQCIRVPLLIRVPGQAARRVPMPVSLLDLRATLTEILGVAMIGITDSSSLLPLIDAPAAVQEANEVVSYWEGARSYRQGTTHRIDYPDGTQERYDLATDPGEFVNLAAPDR
jgi:arylsulfatase A-like enzyme